VPAESHVQAQRMSTITKSPRPRNRRCEGPNTAKLLAALLGSSQIAFVYTAQSQVSETRPLVGCESRAESLSLPPPMTLELAGARRTHIYDPPLMLRTWPVT